MDKAVTVCSDNHVFLTDGVLEDVVSVLTEVDGEGRDHERNSCT